jgi:hypothetical protein
VSKKNLSGLAAAFLLVFFGLGAGLCPAASGPLKKGPEPLTDQQKQDIGKLADEFRQAKTQAARCAPLRKIVSMGPEAAMMACAVVDEALAAQEKAYFDLLNKHIHAAYVNRLCMLRDDHIRKVQYMRRLWKDYLEHTSDQHEFQKNFLTPVWDVAEFLVIKPEQMTEPEIVQQRKFLFELAEYRSACRTAAGISEDPTVGRKSPTGIDIPNLDEPPTLPKYFSLLDRTVALAGSFAPEGGKKVLLKNLEVFRNIDVQESEFIMYCETVRMLVGSVAWFGDELVCAATRDHSTDRVAKLASGHMSTVEGKHGFTDRLRRMGAPFCGSEGAGGGNSGPDYAHQLSYGGGHTHPLYSIKRNFTGVGRRGGCYTSNYGTKKDLLYPCPVTEQELFMPPGLTKADLKTPELPDIHQLLKDEKFADAYAKITALKLKDDADKTVLRFFAAWVNAELDWFFESANAIVQAGDIYEAQLRFADAKKKFTGMPIFDKKAVILDKLLSSKKMQPELEAGKAYRPIARGIIKDIRDNKLDQAAARKQLDDFAKQHPKTVYAEAAMYNPPPDTTGHNDTGINPIRYFLSKNADLPKYAYYTYGLEVSDEWPPRK